MALHLKLRRGEKLLLNGALLEMGGRYGEVLIHNQSHCLRDSEILREAEVTTPTRHVYFQVQMMIVDPANAPIYRERFAVLVDQLLQAFKKPEIARRLEEVRIQVAQGQVYRALALLRAVLSYEDMLLAAAELEAAREAERLAHAKCNRMPPSHSKPGAQSREARPRG
jgi:flagellar biosynthesis repressor protein FlbT